MGQSVLMRPERSVEDMQKALAVSQRVLKSLRRELDPGYEVRTVIQAMEDEQADLLALLLDSRASRSINR
jgi:hypothetical protein